MADILSIEEEAGILGDQSWQDRVPEGERCTEREYQRFAEAPPPQNLQMSFSTAVETRELTTKRIRKLNNNNNKK